MKGLGEEKPGRAERRAGQRNLGRLGIAEVKIWNGRSEVLQVVKKEKELSHGDNCTSFFFFPWREGDAEIEIDAIERKAKLGDATRKLQRTPTESLTTQSFWYRSRLHSFPRFFM